MFKTWEETGENTFHYLVYSLDPYGFRCTIMYSYTDALLLPFCLTEKDLLELKLMTVVAHVFFKRPN